MLIRKIESLKPDVLVRATIGEIEWTIGTDRFMIYGTPRVSPDVKYDEGLGHESLKRFTEYLSIQPPDDVYWALVPAIQTWLLQTHHEEKIGEICGVLIDAERLSRLVSGFTQVVVWGCELYGVPALGVKVQGRMNALLAGVKSTATRSLPPYDFKSQYYLGKYDPEKEFLIRTEGVDHD